MCWLSRPGSRRPPAPPDAPVLLGDVVLAFETVLREAAEQGKPIGDHLGHLVVHGVLHLLGYDHLTAAEADDDGVAGDIHLGQAGSCGPLSRSAMAAGNADPLRHE